MQFVEVSATGVRSAVITLMAADKPQRIVLYPMLHLSTPRFYADVTARLGQCSVVVAEGIKGGSLITRAVTISYRLPGRRARLGLVQQRIDYASLDAQVIMPDLTGRQLRAGWRAVPLLQRAGLPVLAPVAGAVFWLLGTKRMMARLAATEDLPDAVDLMLRDQATELMELLLDRRDALLAAAVDEVLTACQDEAIDIAVVYGAAHMRALTRYLAARHGFRPRSAEWLTAFDF